jgi:hypothetical protein
LLIVFAKVDPVALLGGAGIMGAIFQKYAARSDE